MHPFTLFFALALAGSLVVELWLLGRQVRAVRAHRDRVPPPFAAAIAPADHARAADYAVAQARLAMAERAGAAALAAAFTVGGGIAAIDAATLGLGLAPLSRQLATVAVFGLATTLAGLPFETWRTFRVEARFGFNRTTPALFAADALKGLAVGALLFLPLAALLLWIMQRAGSAWWAWAFGAWAAFTVLVGWAWPRVIAPLFNRFRELEAGSLREGVESLARRCGFEPRGIYVMDGSRRSAHGNAYFTGLGRSKRIVFFDTLLGTLAPAELQAVLAHELGHYRLRHVALRLALSLAAALAGFALLAWLGRQSWFQPALGVPARTPQALLLLFLVAAPPLLFPLRPLAAALSRRHEFDADRFAAAHADAGSLADALVKLYRDNASTLTPDPLYAAFHASHPPALARIARLAPERYA
ncbi:MAG TPA: M48 family metallopeptidase [Steroidobacteraceae bacterium]|nr:M48 family metallopeptidase [Steroidobacteraceae bacterium]